MSFQLQGGSAATNDYDYQSGSGMDNFMSRSIDEVSWQANLGSVYNSLSELPIGLSPTTATPTNFDATQVSGSQSGSSSLGGSNGGSALGNANGAGAGINIQAGSNNIVINDGTNNRGIAGYNPTTNTWGFFATPPGIDIGHATTPQQLAMSTDYSSLLVLANQQIQFPAIAIPNATTLVWQQFTIPHGQPNIPAFFAFLFVDFDTNPILGGLVQTYWAPIVTNFVVADPEDTTYSYNIGADSTNLYIQRIMTNSEMAATASAASVSYQILQQTATTNSNPPNAVLAAGSQAT